MFSASCKGIPPRNWLWSAGLPLALGLGIYGLYTADTFPALFLRWLMPELPLLSGPRFLRNYLCDICWAWSLTVAAAAVTEQAEVTVLCALFAGFLELLQLVLPGTFDLWDLILEISACLLAGLFMKRRILHE